jgi:class 3 adenylate cyclase
MATSAVQPERDTPKAVATPGAAPGRGGLAAVRAAVRDAMRWDDASKALLIEALAVPPILLGALRVWYLMEHPEVEPYLNRDALRVLLWVCAIYPLRLPIVVPLGLALRRSPRWGRVFAHFISQIWWLSLALATYMHGPATTPLWVLYPVLGLLSLLLFDARVAFTGFVSSLVFLFATAIAERAGLLPYGPIFSRLPIVDGRVENTWFWSSMIWPTLVSTLVFSIVALLVRRSREQAVQIERSAEILKRMFGRYLSTELMHTLLDNPEAFEGGGERCKVTILMSDLRGFTALAERMPPEQVLATVNEYFRAMIDVCLAHGGSINEILGDALFVIFGAPLPMEDHAAAAVACAIDMQNAMRQVNERNRHAGHPELQMGIGLNTTVVVVGNIGSERRAKFGVLGSGVNATGRIESYSTGGQVLASQSVVDEVREGLRIDARHEVLPKGASSPIVIHEVGGIGGRYNVALTAADQAFRPPPCELQVEWTAVAGKHLAGGTHRSAVLGLSATGLELADGYVLAAFDDVRLKLAQGSTQVRSTDLYGKVVAVGTEGPQSARIRFTAVPPEILTYIEGLLTPAPPAGRR